jgi:hypothetical protein
VTFIFQRSPVKLLLPKSILESLDIIIPFPEPKPSLVAFFLLIGLWPGGIYMAWKIGNRSLVDSLRTSCGEGISFIHAAVCEINNCDFFPLFDVTGGCRLIFILLALLGVLFTIELHGCLSCP